MWALAHTGVMTPAIEVLRAAGIGFSIHEYDHGDDGIGFGLEAARELGLDPAVVFKTLVVLIADRAAVAVIPVNTQLDLKAVAAALGGKRAQMCPVADAERRTGYVAGGISPLGQRRRLPTVLDTSAFDHEHIYVSGGRRGLDIGLAPADLVELAGAVAASIAARPSM